MKNDSKLCAHCGKSFNRTTEHTQNWNSKKCCSKECVNGLYNSKRRQDRARTPQETKALKRRVELERIANQEGKRAKVDTYSKWAASDDDDNHPKNIAQRKYDRMVDEKYTITFSSKILTPEEIDAIKHQITPIERISNDINAVIYAESDPGFSRRRNEESGNLFNERK